MRLSLEAKLATRDEREVPFPLDESIVFTIARSGKRSYRDYLEKRQADNPVFQRALLGSIGASVAGDDSDEARTKAVLQSLEKLDPELVKLSDFVDNEGVAKHLIVDIDGLVDMDTGEEVPYSIDVGLELLEKDAPIDQPIMGENGEGKIVEVVPAGMALGDAIRLWVLHEAARWQAFRESFQEAAEKN